MAKDIDDYISPTETREFQIYALRIANFIKQADTSNSEMYKGVSFGDIHRELGDSMRALTQDALNEIKARPVGLIPERYTFKPPVVRSVPLSEGKPFPSVSRPYKANERPSTLGLPQRATI